MLFISYSCSNDDPKVTDTNTGSRKTNAPHGLISPERAMELNANWNKSRSKAIESAIGKSDNQSVQFSLQDMRDYLDYAENEAKELGYEMNGVRIYFAAYGEGDPIGHSNEATLFLVPTGKKTISEASMFSMFQNDGKGDIPGGKGLNAGNEGMPPTANYPQ